MIKTEYTTAGIEVHEPKLDKYQMGFLTGVFAAWGVRAPTHNEFRDAMELLNAHGDEMASY